MSEAMPLFHQYAFMAWCSDKAQEQLYLLPYFILCLCEDSVFGTRH